jgi:hypothetical protein
MATAALAKGRRFLLCWICKKFKGKVTNTYSYYLGHSVATPIPVSGYPVFK